MINTDSKKLVYQTPVLKVIGQIELLTGGGDDGAQDGTTWNKNDS